MASVNEEAAAVDYLVTYLGADATLSSLVNGVWTRSVPQSAPMPAVKIDRLDADDVYVIGLHRVWDDLTFLVRGTAEHQGGSEPQDWSEVRAIGDRIDELLHDHEVLTSELQMHAFREESFTDETIEGGKLYLHVGGIYRLRASAV
jgi:hypothetical protein